MKRIWSVFYSITLLFNEGCSSTRTAAKSDTAGSKGAISQNEQNPQPVAEAPRRPIWGSNISPYFN